jgi:hypothetical protein
MSTIQLPTPITQPSVTADAVWVRSINISSPSTTAKSSAVISVCPMVSSTGYLLIDKTKQIRIPDIYASANNSLGIAAALDSILAAIQNIILSQNTFNSGSTN